MHLVFARFWFSLRPDVHGSMWNMGRHRVLFSSLIGGIQQNYCWWGMEGKRNICSRGESRHYFPSAPPCSCSCIRRFSWESLAISAPRVSIFSWKKRNICTYNRKLCLHWRHAIPSEARLCMMLQWEMLHSITQKRNPYVSNVGRLSANAVWIQVTAGSEMIKGMLAEHWLNAGQSR